MHDLVMSSAGDSSMSRAFRDESAKTTCITLWVPHSISDLMTNIAKLSLTYPLTTTALSLIINVRTSTTGSRKLFMFPHKDKADGQTCK